MKKILITGARSYIGTSFEEWMKQFGDDYQIDTLDMRDPNWKEYDFSIYDSIFHVAGIAHIKETRENRELYEDINYKLVMDLANIAKQQGVSQFIFLSSMSVYGVTSGTITKNTEMNPTNYYGKSKLKAEQYLKSLKCETFIISIVRPPMVYGKNCKGNYQKLRKLALISPVFPNIRNERSMIYIGNLCFFIYSLVQKEHESTEYNVQNSEFVETSELVKKIALAHNKNIFLSYKIVFFINKLSRFSNKIKKLYDKSFGSLTYEKEDSYQVDFICFDESIKLTEEENK